jgi:ribose transport system substrate-binding protein
LVIVFKSQFIGSRASMKPLNILVSLITQENDFQMEQAASAQAAALKLGIQLQIVYADNEAVNQSQQLFTAIQSTGHRPDGIAVEPVGTGMAQAATAAVSAGIGWGVVNREVDYLARLRGGGRVPVFAVATDHNEVGKIEGAQISALVPGGGEILYIEGPIAGGVSKARSTGMFSSIPKNISVKVLRGDWTEKSGHHAVKAWLSLSTSRAANIQAISAQNDAMAIGARKAFEEIADPKVRREWLSLPFLGCDGVEKAGREWVRRGLLCATVVTPPPMGPAVEILVNALRSGVQPPECTVTHPVSHPSLETLKANRVQAQAARSTDSQTRRTDALRELSR